LSERGLENFVMIEKGGMRITLAKYPISIDQVKFPLVQGEYVQTKNQMKLNVYLVDFELTQIICIQQVLRAHRDFGGCPQRED
jgi:hypothetical protein